MKHKFFCAILLGLVSIIVLSCESQESQKAPPEKVQAPPTSPPAKEQVSEAEIHRVLPLIQRELDSWDDDTGDGGRWEKQKVSWNGKSFIVEIEMMSFADLRPGNPMPNSLAQNEYLKLGHQCVKKYASWASCTVNLVFGNNVVNSRSYQ